METKEFRIEIPEGYEIDKEKSSFEKIVFKKKRVISSWGDLEKIRGVFIDYDSRIQGCEALPGDCNKNIFLNEKYAKSALALAQISQLLPYYDTNNDYSTPHYKYCIIRSLNDIVINKWSNTYHLLSFNTIQDAERFLKYNEQLVKDYYMI